MPDDSGRQALLGTTKTQNVQISTCRRCCRCCWRFCFASSVCVALFEGYWVAMQNKKCTYAALPSQAGASIAKRHKNGTGASQPLAAPKIIWSFWGQWRNICSINGPCKAPCLNEKAPWPSIVQLSIDSWKKKNPDYEVHVLEEDTVWNYLDRTELPASYECIDSVHTSDVIRTALLVKYGGVWLDASIILLRPLSEILGNVTHPSTYIVPGFMGLQVDVENCFLADTPNGKLLPKVKDCLWNFYEHQGYATQYAGLSSLLEPWCYQAWFPRSFGAPGQYFSASQLAEFKKAKLTTYLEMHGCFWKVLDENPDLKEWWDSDAVIKVDAEVAMFVQTLKGWYPDEYVPPLLEWVDTDLANKLSERSWMLKFSASNKGAFNKDMHHLQCDESTLKLVLLNHSLLTPADCAEAREL